MTQNEINSNYEKFWWIVEMGYRNSNIVKGAAEDMLPSDMLLTGKMVEDEDFDMATAPATSPAPRKNPFS